MKKTIPLIIVYLIILALIIYYFKPSTTIRPINTETTQSKVSTEQKELSETQQVEKTSEKKVENLSDTATQYYKNAYKYGWESIVSDFEKGIIQRSNMSEKEKIKLCSLAIKSVNFEQTQRLFNANCRPTDGKDTYYLINRTLKNEHGQPDQDEIIKKLKFYKEKNLLQTEVSYKIGSYEEKSNLQANAVGFGLEKVSDYLLSIGVNYDGSYENLILTNVSGINPTISMIQKLQKAGYKIDENVFKRIEEQKFIHKHPEIYQYLKQNQ